MEQSSPPLAFPFVTTGMDMSPTGSALVTLCYPTQPRSPTENPKIQSILLLDRGRADGRKEDAHLRGMNIENLLYVASSVGEELKKQKPSLAMLEDYSGGDTHNAFVLACTGEVTGAAKLWLRQERIPWAECAAGTLKKFVTGVGAGKKELMWLGAYKKWGLGPEQIGDNNNVLDAYCCARFALFLKLVQAGIFEAAKFETECIRALREGGSARSMGKKKRGRSNGQG
jgi:Holliday junction resolvasome RuvABC endonuclease subunit